MMIYDSGLLFGPPCIQVTIEVCAYYTLFSSHHIAQTASFSRLSVPADKLLPWVNNLEMWWRYRWAYRAVKK